MARGVPRHTSWIDTRSTPAIPPSMGLRQARRGAALCRYGHQRRPRCDREAPLRVGTEARSRHAGRSRPDLRSLRAESWPRCIATGALAAPAVGIIDAPRVAARGLTAARSRPTRATGRFYSAYSTGTLVPRACRLAAGPSRSSRSHSIERRGWMVCLRTAPSSARTCSMSTTSRRRCAKRSTARSAS
jgi:hypothetical protein